jgi:hypothetical protein
MLVRTVKGFSLGESGDPSSQLFNHLFFPLDDLCAQYNLAGSVYVVGQEGNNLLLAQLKVLFSLLLFLLLFVFNLFLFFC